MILKLTHKNLSIMMLILSLLFTINACSDDEDPAGPETETPSSGITMSLKTTGGNETEFIVTKENIMEGEISAEGTGIELTGWRFFYQVNSTLFASGYSDDNQCAAYTNVNGEIVSKGGFIFENALEMFGHSEDGSTLLAMEIPRAGFGNRRLHFVNVENVTVDKIIGTRIFESQADSLVAWPTSLMVRENKLFIPFHKLDALGYFTTPSADSAYIAVYPYPEVTATPEKIISDPRTSNIGVNGSTTGLIQTERGDIYSFSCGAVMAGFSPASSKNSGILRIKAGTTDFDDSYFFDVEAATGGGKLFWFDYVGGNRAIARILTDDNGGAWGAYGRDVFNQKLVIIDLENQTITDVQNVPLHAKRYSSPVLVEDGYVYVSIETATEAYVYKVDVEAATGIKGAKIIGKTVKGFYRL